MFCKLYNCLLFLLTIAARRDTIGATKMRDWKMRNNRECRTGKWETAGI